MTSRIACFFLFFFLWQTSHSQSEWVLKKEKNGIFIYVLEKEKSAFNSIKVETEFIGRADDLVDILLDVANHDKWAYGTKSASLLKQISSQEIIFYKEIETPGLVSNRDIVMHLKAIRTPSTHSIRIEGEAMPGLVPPKKDLVRVPVSNEIWIINTVSEQKLKVQYFLQIDPGGSLPPLLVNLFASHGPIETFENLKKLLKEKISN